jgi:peptide/nickel transport system substrate-binding protein
VNLRRISLAALLFLTACASPAAPTAPALTGGGAAPQPAEQRSDNQRINIAVKGLIGNPTPQASSFNFWLYWPMYDNLTMLDENYKVLPSVAEKWDLGADQKSWRFTIRKDLKFSNGDPLTADDVAFTLNTIIQKNWPQKGQFTTATEAKVVDDKTVDLFSTQLDVTIPANMAYVWIVDKKYYDSAGFDGYVTKPIGSGPYVLTDFKANDSMTFKKRSEPHPFHKVEADELFFKVVPENSQILNGLITGDIDIATQFPGPARRSIS